MMQKRPVKLSALHSHGYILLYLHQGLLFLVLASPYSSDREAAGGCIFRLIAANPRRALCVHVMSYTLPEGHTGRYLEGDVDNHSAAAVLTCGSIALWDLPRSHCSTLLPPSSDMHWCLLRWSHSSSCLLTGQKDGTICVYEYTESYSRDKRTRNPMTLENTGQGYLSG
ncbi:hypothetical protein FKM82_019062 [Ascaphus truei]